jgi:hypothetical protein
MAGIQKNDFDIINEKITGYDTIFKFSDKLISILQEQNKTINEQNDTIQSLKSKNEYQLIQIQAKDKEIAKLTAKLEDYK